MARDSEVGPWGERDPAETPAAAEPVFVRDKPPWPWAVLLLISGLSAIWVAGVFVPGLREGALSREALRSGQAYTLVTHIGLHAGLPHLVFNMMALAQLGREIGPLFGRTLRGGLVFLGFFLACGLAGGLAFVALNPTGAAVGASGAICGIWGGAARLSGKGTLADAFLGASARGFVMMNLILVGLGLLLTGLRSAGVAWEAHLGGYVAGVLLIIPAIRLARGGPQGMARKL